MRIAVYARVSTQRQTQMQTIHQQLERLQAHFQTQEWDWARPPVFRDDGYSGASLKRPGLDRLREQAAQAHFDRVLITAPDRLARKFIHQMLLIEELEKSRPPRRVCRATDEPGSPRSIAAADPPTGCATRLLLGAPRLLDHCRSPHAQSGGGSWLSGFTVGLAAGCT